jgi:hypothetical protein
MRITTKRCPYVENPFEECYVNGLGSAAVEKSVYYCANHFDECDIYAAHANGERENTGSDAGNGLEPAKPSW